MRGWRKAWVWEINHSVRRKIPHFIMSTILKDTRTLCEARRGPILGYEGMGRACLWSWKALVVEHNLHMPPVNQQLELKSQVCAKQRDMKAGHSTEAVFHLLQKRAVVLLSKDKSRLKDLWRRSKRKSPWQGAKAAFLCASTGGFLRPLWPLAPQKLFSGGDWFGAVSRS